MVKLTNSLTYEIRPIPPYSFGLTIRKPAGWSLFTQFEVCSDGEIWTATHMNGMLVGIRLYSEGGVKRPRIIATVFTKRKLGMKDEERIKRTLNHSIGADQDLGDFYSFASKDGILKHAVKDLYGMQNTSSSTIYPDAVLSILLQMTTLKRSNEMMNCFVKSYGDLAEFDGKRIYTWPLPEKVAEHGAGELARRCRLGYRAKSIVKLSRKIAAEGFPSIEELERLEPQNAKDLLLELPGIGDYSADIINPHGGFPIDVWSAEVFGKLFYGKEPKNNRNAVERIKREGLRRWGVWAWMAFFYTVQDLKNLSVKLNTKLRLE